MSIKYRVERPGAGTVSRHRTLEAAKRSLARQVAGARKQGGYSLDRIEVCDGGEWWEWTWYSDLAAGQWGAE